MYSFVYNKIFGEGNCSAYFCRERIIPFSIQEIFMYVKIFSANQNKMVDLIPGFHSLVSHLSVFR